MSQQVAELDPRTFREVLGHYPTGVVLITGIHPDGEKLAMIIGSFTSVSLDPPLVAFLPMKTSYTFKRLQECESLCINVLSGDQEAVGRTVASRKTDKFNGLEWYPSPSGDPVLTDSLAWIDVRLTEVVEGGDHWIALCRVVDMAVANPSSPLIFFQGGYGRFAVPSLVARIDEDLIGGIRQAEALRDELEVLAANLGCEAGIISQANPHELAVVASAVAPGIPMEGTGLGERFPLIPPLGDMFVASGPPEMEELWLSRAVRPTEEDLAQLRSRLEFVRKNGFSLSLRSAENSHPFLDMMEATRRHNGGGLTPVEEKEILATISKALVCYKVEDLDPEQTYLLGSLVVPVSDGSGPADLVLRITQLPEATGEEVVGWADALKAAAERMVAVLSGQKGPATVHS